MGGGGRAEKGEREGRKEGKDGRGEIAERDGWQRWSRGGRRSLEEMAGGDSLGEITEGEAASGGGRAEIAGGDDCAEAARGRLAVGWQKAA